jgi:undecaprenyl-diphosphatase
MFSLKPSTLVPVAAALAFIGLAALVASGYSFAFDSKLILLFRQAGDPSVPLGPAWLREAMRDLTALGSFVGLGLMMVTASLILWKCDHRRLAVGLIVSIVTGVLVSTALKIVIGRNRPDIVEHAALTFTASFPSGHAFLSAVTLLCIAGFVGLAVRRDDITRLCVFLAWVMILLIGLSRIYLGVHWPTDVLAGWCLGTAWSSLAIAWLGRSMAAAEVKDQAPRPESRAG